MRIIDDEWMNEWWWARKMTKNRFFDVFDKKSKKVEKSVFFNFFSTFWRFSTFFDFFRAFFGTVEKSTFGSKNDPKWPKIDFSTFSRKNRKKLKNMFFSTFSHFFLLFSICLRSAISQAIMRSKYYYPDAEHNFDILF